MLATGARQQKGVHRTKSLCFCRSTGCPIQHNVAPPPPQQSWVLPLHRWVLPPHRWVLPLSPYTPTPLFRRSELLRAARDRDCPGRGGTPTRGVRGTADASQFRCKGTCRWWAQISAHPPQPERLGTAPHRWGLPLHRWVLPPHRWVLPPHRWVLPLHRAYPCTARQTVTVLRSLG